MPYQFPYTNLHDLDLDWMLNQVKDAKDKVDSFTSEENYNNIVNDAVERVENSDQYQQTMTDVVAAGTAATQAANSATEAAGRANSAAQTAEDVSDIVAEPFVTNKDYSEGWYVTYSGGLYKFITFHSAGAWDDTEVEAVTVGTQLTSIDNLKSAISETTRNLWLWGDQAVTGRKLVTSSANIPAGTYTLSALVTKNESGNVRMMFYRQNVAATEQLANPYIAANSRNSKTFTLAEDCHTIVVYSAANASGTIPAVWSNIQIEEGSAATDYTPPLTAVDVVARADASGAAEHADNISARLNRQIMLTNTTYTGEHTETIVLPNYNTYTETPIISCDAMFTRNSNVTDYPRVQLRMNNARNIERNSTWYRAGKEGQYEIKEWRAPAFEIWQNNEVRLFIYVPAGCTLTIRNLWLRYDNSVDRTQARGAEFFARPGTCNMVPELTIPALQMAYRHGYGTFTVIPKLSSDGVWFAYHDDTWDISTTQLRNPDGSVISDTSYNGAYFHTIPFTYLEQFKFTQYGNLFSDVGLMKLEDCFAFLAKTGMKLRFSLHPAIGINSITNLTSLKRLVQKYGLLKDLTIIVNDITSVFPVFQNDIGGYCFPNSTEASWADGAANPVNKGFIAAQSAKETYGITVPINCGLWSDSLFADREKTTELVNDILDAGFTAGVFTYTYVGIDGASHNYLWSGDMRWLMTIGVTEFTDGYNTSVGLNW